MIGARPAAVVSVGIIHPEVVVTHLGRWRHHVRVGHERVSLARQSLRLLVLNPLLLANLIPGAPIWARPERIQWPTLDAVEDEGDDGSEWDLQSNDQCEEPSDAVSPIWIKDDSAIGWWGPVVDGEPKDDD